MRILPCLLLVFLTGCSTIKKWVGLPSEEEVSAEEDFAAPREDDAYADGLEFLAKGQDEKAVDTLEKFLRESPASRYYLAATFHLGRAYENLTAWGPAIDSYRRVAVSASSGKELRARALYRLSFCYEAIGETTKAVASLLDALARKNHLPFEVAQAEAPARLAAAYARLGNEKEAMSYYSAAEAGIRHLRRQHPDETPPWLPKTLFYMGTINDLEIQPREFAADVRPLKKAQIYLLQAAELKDPHWSEMAASRLKAVYQALWQAVENVPLADDPDEILARRQRQDTQWNMAHLILDVLEDLRLNRLPQQQESPYVVQVFHFIEQYEGQVRDFLNAPPVGQGKTPAARAREGMVPDDR